MITALASDYRSVYHVNLDFDDAVCYRADPSDKEQHPEGVHFPYYSSFEDYCNRYVDEDYRSGFLTFIQPDNIRQALAADPIIAYRYLVRRDGREYYEMLRMAGVRHAEDREDHIVHAIGLGFTVIDAEMRESMAQSHALIDALKAAQEANKAKTAFLSSMSHEIRTPLNAIIGLNLLAMKDSTLSAGTREHLEKTDENARHLLSLINNILDMSRIESGKLVLQREEFSFSGMLDQINTMVMSQCRDKGLKYECRISSPVDEYYIADDTKLKQVLINILGNAVKFTDAPGNITLEIERTAEFDEQSTLKFTITDTGIGMDREFIPKVFDSFAQEDGSRSNKYGSTGLGLAIAKSIVDMMNGSISVRSEKGIGSEFTVVVTLKNCDRDMTAAGSVKPGNLYVLLADDDETVCEHARAVLNKAGIKADTCSSGRAALQMLETQRAKHESYNLVILDWQMSGMDGLDTAKHIKQEYDRDIPVLLLTAYSREEVGDEALSESIDGFLPKPLSVRDVIDALERATARRSTARSSEKQRAELKGRHILIAEDMLINAEIVKELIKVREATADHAENGRSALEMFEKSPPGFYDAILMDIRMPEMDGLDAAERIRALDRPDAKRIPIVALTANAFDEDVQRSLQAGINAHLSKPVDPDKLFLTLEELIFKAGVSG